MKHAPILFALAMFFGAVPAHADGVSFAEANGKYQAGDFKGAEALYKKLLDSGLRTAPVYYNYGNASFRNGKKGQALVAYERRSGGWDVFVFDRETNVMTRASTDPDLFNLVLDDAALDTRHLEDGAAVGCEVAS